MAADNKNEETVGADEESGERAPLLGGPEKSSRSCMDCGGDEKSDTSRTTLTSRMVEWSKRTFTIEEKEDFDEMAYHPASLLSWYSLLLPRGSIWRSSHLWTTMAQLFLVNIIVAVLVILVVPDPLSLKIENFLKISYFLNFFVGLLVGFFMKTSLERWHECAQGFLELGDSIRNLQMQFHALGVPEERNDLCVRYGLLSGWFLKLQLVEEMMPAKEMPAARANMWKALTAAPHQEGRLGCTPLLERDEMAMIREISDPAGVMWTWITSLIARMAEDGQIPGMATPTYGRIMNLAQDAHGGIRHVRTSVSVRAPFVYVHMLASLVHINNILNALCFGLVLGVAVSGHLIHRGWHFYSPRASGNDVERDAGFCFVAFFVCTCGPILYQAITEISVSLTQPFASAYGRIPIDRLMHNLAEDLRDGKAMALHCPHWQHPSFQVPSK